MSALGLDVLEIQLTNATHLGWPSAGFVTLCPRLIYRSLTFTVESPVQKTGRNKILLTIE